MVMLWQECPFFKQSKDSFGESFNWDISCQTMYDFELDTVSVGQTRQSSISL